MCRWISRKNSTWSSPRTISSTIQPSTNCPATWPRSARRAQPSDKIVADMEIFSSLVALLARRAQSQLDDRAYIFLSDRGDEEAVLTFRELHEAAQSLAAQLTGMSRPGERALLVFPPGLEFLVAFFGCLIAGVIAVPMMMPRRQSARDSSAAIMANCEPVVALTNSAFAIRKDLHARFLREQIQWLAVDLTHEPGAADLRQPDP